MRKSLLLRAVPLACILCGAAYLAFAADKEEDNLSLDALPAPVKAAVLQQSGGAPLTELEREIHGGEAVYEAEWKVDGVEHEAAFAADGTLLETEEEITLEQAPPAVRSAVATAFGADAKVEVARKTFVVYEVEGKVDGKGKEITISPTGKIHGPGSPGAEPEDGADDDEDDDG